MFLKNLSFGVDFKLMIKVSAKYTFFKIFPIKIHTLLHAFEQIVEALLPNTCFGDTLIRVAQALRQFVQTHAN